MKYLIFTIFLIACICAGSLLVLDMDVSHEYESQTEPAAVARMSRMGEASLCNNTGVPHSDSIAEDPEVGILLLPYDYSAPVPEREPVENEFFNRAVFIGDSRMLGLVKYNDLEPINYCSVGFSVGLYDTSSFIKHEDKTLTVKEALRVNDDFDMVYISTGINELGWSIGKFAEKYRAMINDIKEVAGDRPIYIQLILPVTRGFETSKYMNPFGLKNSNVTRFNAELVEIAKECRIYYFDCSENFLLDDGTLDPNKSSDGAHLTLEAYAEQLDIYKSHVVNRKEYAW
ncbi:MAG: hypothetical protein IJD67_01460 [Clostridia bacterium]|nr:hypothetical protein [Clostridia bacterium]